MTRVTWAYKMQAGGGFRPARVQAPLVAQLAAGFVTERALKRSTGLDPAALLLQLDQAGQLARELRTGRQAWAQLLPQRRPDLAPAATAPPGPLRLVDSAVVHAAGQGLTLEAPGAWARLRLLQPDLLALLHSLGRGCTLDELQRQWPGAGAALDGLLQLIRACGLLQPGPASHWAAHDLLLHTRTRRGYGATAVGRQSATMPTAQAVPAGDRLALPKGEAADLQMTLARALGDRQSLRQHGAVSLSVADLGRLLWHVFAPQARADGSVHHAYPSGGGCYSLRPHVVVGRCAGLPPGAYAYEAHMHRLVRVDDGSTPITTMLRDAASSAGQQVLPQVLLVLCADYARMRSAYGDLGYSLLLKEVGAVMQTVQLVATALGLASCPLGTGHAHAFARLAGADAWQLPSVGEVMLGSRADALGGIGG